MDIFDRINATDLFDRTELATEEKVIFSDVFRDAVKKEIQGIVSNIPVGKMITDILQKEMEKQGKAKKEIEQKIYWTRSDMEKDTADLRNELKELRETVKKKHEDFKNDLIKSKEVYTFGGFSPQFNDLNIGDPSSDGAWRIVKSSTDLSIQRRESGVWVEKGAFTA